MNAEDSNIPTVTVGLPTFNRAGYLRECLSSILNQSFVDFEVIVSDNCSGDATREVVRSCGDSRVRYYRNETNIGPIANMNRCLSLARGQYVVIAHDDDVYGREYLERSVAILSENPTVGMVHCATCEIDEYGNVRRLVRAYETTGILPGKREFLRYLSGHNVCCSTAMAPRRVYEQMGGFDSRYMCWDWLMWLRVALQYDVGYVAEPLVGMRVHGRRVSTSMTAEKWYREFLDIFEKAYTEGLVLSPGILGPRGRHLRTARNEQGRRFFIAAMQAASLGEFTLCREYGAVLAAFQGGGMPRLYAWIIRMVGNRAGGCLLVLVRLVRRFWASSAAVLALTWQVRAGRQKTS